MHGCGRQARRPMGRAHVLLSLMTEAVTAAAATKMMAIDMEAGQ